jgi:DUF971 family protein
MAFVAGERVEALYDHGEEWYPGEIQSVNADGTFQIRYDDGDSEVLEATYIRGFNVVTGVVPSSFAVGDRVEALYDRGEEWYAGKIQTVHTNGTCSVLYDDGDTEDLETRWIRNPHEGGNGVPSQAPRSPLLIEPVFTLGERVEALYGSEDTWYAGKIQAVNADGTFGVLYDDGDEETLDKTCVRSAGPAAFQQARPQDGHGIQSNDEDEKYSDGEDEKYSDDDRDGRDSPGGGGGGCSDVEAHPEVEDDASIDGSHSFGGTGVGVGGV